MSANPRSTPDVDEIRIEQLKLLASLGVSQTERSQVQPITISLRLWPMRSFDQLEDRVENTVNYANVAAALRKIVASRADHLIETLAENIAQSLLADFPLRRLQIELRKFVVSDAEYVSVVLSRERGSET